MFLWMSLITGILYPLLITGIAQLTMNNNANGSFITYQEKLVGSSLIGQKFSSDKYFWGRPSFIDYNPLPSGGSNLGPTSMALKTLIEERRAFLSKAHEITDPNLIPNELLFSSGSGLDPHITYKTAYFQINRVLKARGIENRSILENMINSLTENRKLGIFGIRHINVLLLNKALDEHFQKKTNK